VFGIDALIAANARLQITNLDRYEKDLARYFEPRQHLVAAMTGLMDDPSSGRRRTTPTRRERFLISTPTNGNRSMIPRQSNFPLGFIVLAVAGANKDRADDGM